MRRRHHHNRRTFVLCAALLVASAGFAQGPGDTLRKEGESAVQAGDYKSAIEKFETFKKKFPADPNAWTVRFDLGRCYLLDGQHDKGVAEYQDLAKPISSPKPELQENAIYWVARGHHLKLEAVAQGGDPKAREAEFAATEKAFEDFFKAFPQTKFKNEALYFRARGRELAEQYDKARADLEAARADLLARPLADRELVQNTSYALAGLYLKQGKALMSAQKKTDAEKVREQGRQLFEQIAKQAANVVMANEANTRIGALLNEDKEYDEAIAWLRRVRPKSEVITAQNYIVAQAQQRYNFTRDARSEQELAIERRRLERLQAAPDPLIASYLIIGAAYLEQQLYPEAMTMFQHLDRFTENPAQRKRAHHGIIVSDLGLNRPDAARDEFEKFQKEFGKDEIAEGTSYWIGRLYLDARPPRYADARAQFEKSLADYPNGRLAANARLGRATAQSPEQSAKILDELKKLELQMAKTELADEYAYSLADALLKDGKYEDAAKKFREVKEKFPKFFRRSEAAYQVGACLLKARKPDEAMAEFSKVATDFAQNQELATECQFQIAACHEAKKDYDSALKQYAHLLQQGARADEAQYQIALIHFSKQDWPKATEAFRALVDKFPQSRLVPSAHFGIGTVLQTQKFYDQAAGSFAAVAEKFPQDPLAADAQLKVGDAWRIAATSLGLPQGLLPEKLKTWQAHAAQAIAAYESVLAKFADRPQADSALSQILALQNLRQQGGLAKEDEVDKYFRELSRKFSNNKALGVKILFAQAKLVKDHARRLKLYGDAFAASERDGVALSAASYESYAKDLLSANPPQVEKTAAAYQKMLSVAADDESKAAALVGLGEVFARQKKFGEAEKNFDRVLKEFAATKAVGDAHLGKAFLLESQNKLEDAIKAYDAATKAEKGPRAAYATFRAGQCFLAKKDDPTAFNYLSRFDVFFSTFPEYAPEADFHCAEILERQNKPADAQRYYEIVVKKYPNSPWAEKARAKLPAPAAPKK